MVVVICLCCGTNARLLAARWTSYNLRRERTPFLSGDLDDNKLVSVGHHWEELVLGNRHILTCEGGYCVENDLGGSCILVFIYHSETTPPFKTTAICADIKLTKSSIKH